MRLINSPISQFDYKQHTFYVKRDDLLDPQFSGNKARKLAYYLENSLPHIDTLVSYGGSQSNLMYSLSCLAKLKQWNFIYYIKTLSTQAKSETSGNLTYSLQNGMQLIELKNDYNSFCDNLASTMKSNQLLIKQGGAQIEAEYGIQQLAHEIRAWAQQQNFQQLAIFIASGTGTSALYLQKHLPEFEVYTTNCVGSPEYLLKQFEALITTKQNKPNILVNDTYRFATPYAELYKTITDIQNTSQIEFDMVYDPIAWNILLNHLNKISSPILYIHCGGTIGNTTMLKRYKKILS